MNSFVLPSFAKINWHLRILGRRADGFHELWTIFQTVSLFDEITFKAADNLTLSCNSEQIPTDDTNSILKAAHLLKKQFDIKIGADIRLVKNIPAPGGLGGGSSNAAIALAGLAKLWNLKLKTAELQTLAAKIGSDVPFFLIGGTALGTDRGTEIQELVDLDEKFMLIVTPPIEVSTAAAFARLNAPRLTNKHSKSILNICRNEAQAFNFRQTSLKNDFETSVFEIYPEIGRIKEKLLEHGAREALLSGSGASVFAIFDKEETRQATLKALENKTNWRKFAVATVSRDQYREALEKVSKVVSD